MNEQEQELRRQAQAAIAAGADPDEVNALLEVELAKLRPDMPTIDGPPSNTGPTPALPFNRMNPIAAGALDALVAFGSSTGVPLAFGDTRKYMAELENRSRGGTRAAQVAGGIPLGVLGGAGVNAARGALARRAAANAPRVPPPNAMLPRDIGTRGFSARNAAEIAAQAPVGPSIISKLLKSRLLRGGGLLGGGYKLRDLIGG